MRKQGIVISVVNLSTMAHAQQYDVDTIGDLIAQGGTCTTPLQAKKLLVGAKVCLPIAACAKRTLDNPSGGTLYALHVSASGISRFGRASTD